MKMDFKLNILTLNCWGIVGISRHRKQRMEAIASHIASSNYDFVFLQEIWSQNDFNMICKKVAEVLPYSYYFFSGVLGSGICILSKSTIVDAALSQFSLNGYAHKILHGDWYGGKGVGLCKVIHHGLKINLYVTHLHAEYDSFHDQYLPHRVAQAFEFSQFVQMTSETADLSIVAGDFNTEPTDLPYKVIIHNAACLDAYLTQKSSILDVNTIRMTCGHPDNLYTSHKELSQCPTGKRIDYILYKCGPGTYVECLSCDTPLGKIPETSIPYSDHEAVVANLHVFKSVEGGVHREQRHGIDGGERRDIHDDTPSMIQHSRKHQAHHLKNERHHQQCYEWVPTEVKSFLWNSRSANHRLTPVETSTMTTLVKSVTDVYDEYMASGDPRVTHWLLMEGPGPTFALVFLYVLFVKKVGPAWMEDRKPFDLRYPMFLYNMVLVLTNFYLILETFRVLLQPSHSWTCRIDNKNDPDALRLAELGWWFFFIKFIEFADTIFFVLRKKNRHISTLHVVHHAVVPIAVWGGLRIEPGSYNYFFPLINTIVHTVMYSYYGLAALGPSVQRYLWWKKYLTTFQMIQFVMVFFYVMGLMITNCKVSKFVIYLNTFLAGLFLIMFYDYFQNTYLKNRAIRKQMNIDAANKAAAALEEQRKIASSFSKEKSIEKKIG